MRFTVYSDNEIQKAVISGLSVIFRIQLSIKNILVLSSDHLVFASEPKGKTNLIYFKYYISKWT